MQAGISPNLMGTFRTGFTLNHPNSYHELVTQQGNQTTFKNHSQPIFNVKTYPQNITFGENLVVSRI